MKDVDLNIRQLRYYVKVIETGSITRASELLFIAQPALSLSIKQLEESFGVPLLSRHSRGVEPTAAGELLFTRAQMLFNFIDQMRTDVSSFGRANQRSFSLGLPPSLMALVGTEAILSSQTNLENTTLTLREDPSFVLTEAVENKEINLAFSYAPIERTGIRSLAMVQEIPLLVTRSDLAPERTVISLEEALRYPIAHGGKRDVGRSCLEFVTSERNLPFEIAYEMQSIAGIRDIVIRGIAASILPYGAVCREVERGSIAIRRIDEPLLKHTMHLIRPANMGTPLSKEIPGLIPYLIDLINEIVNKQQGYAKKIGSNESLYDFFETDY
ncbi:MAG: hypothetical protein CML17_07345 [Pusillimonas sp.]|nr:hypothetical protein [Pusillimonas sp.]